MKTNLKIKSFAGNTFNSIAKEAQSKATETQNVEYEFNGVTVIVSPKTNLEKLWQYMSDAYVMGWKTIGHETPDYSEELKAEIEAEKIKREIEAEKRQEEYRKKEQAEKEAFELTVIGIEFVAKDLPVWLDYVAKNDDPYGKCAVDYARDWGRLMQVEIAKGSTVKKCAEKTSHQLGFYGITGFMYGCAVPMLSNCWIHGEELRKWHNKEYGHEGEGVVNPAVLTIGG